MLARGVSTHPQVKAFPCFEREGKRAPCIRHYVFSHSQTFPFLLFSHAEPNANTKLKPRTRTRQQAGVCRLVFKLIQLFFWYDFLKKCFGGNPFDKNELNMKERK